MSGIKRDATDAAYSTLIRERAEWVCEVCATYYPEDNRRGLECSHFWTRRNLSIRWHPLAACAMCTRCHFYYGGNPVEFSTFIRDWYEIHYSPETFNEMFETAHSVCKRTKGEKLSIRKHLQAELKRIQGLRADGVTGRLEFVGYA